MVWKLLKTLSILEQLYDLKPILDAVGVPARRKPYPNIFAVAISFVFLVVFHGLVHQGADG